MSDARYAGLTPAQWVAAAAVAALVALALGRRFRSRPVPAVGDRAGEHAGDRVPSSGPRAAR